MALAIFCFQNDIGFSGEDVGISEKLCNDFFPTPTDSGMCLTKNLDIKEILYEKKEYDSLFEPYQQNPSMKIEGGTKWGEISLVLVPSQNEFYNWVRSPGAQDRKLKIQLHQSKDFANLMQTKVYDDFLIPLTLEPKHEYTIRVTPYGKISSDGFKDLGINQRSCKLEEEVSEGSSFQSYTEKNCKYECTVNLAIELCKCAPWDFIHKSVEGECDVFGRTCFYTAMENLTQLSNDPCSHCIQGCDHMKYKKEIIEDRLIMPNKNYEWGNSYLYCSFIYNETKCKGEKSFVEFFFDANSTFNDMGFYNMNDCLRVKDNHNSRTGRATMMYENAIILHLKFMEPEVDIVDVKYTLMDKFANFGGKFGIFAQLTGWSLLGILNLCLVLFKHTIITK